MLHHLFIPAAGKGLHDITRAVRDAVARSADALSPDRTGLCTIFIQHTSASLLIQENADPSARQDLESWLDRLVPEHDPLYTHNDEGPDDMPAHVKAMLTCVSLSIPIEHAELALGTWQGIYLWEHRRRPHTRRVLVHVGP
jgi:secondary thiamine-phosphate synthase enzyme